MLRSLHPDREAQQYVPTWRGDSWRQVDFTPGPLPDYSTVGRKRGRPSMADMLASLTEPKTVFRAANDLGITRSSASNLLWRLHQEGRIVKIQVAAGYRRRASVKYARAR